MKQLAIQYLKRTGIVLLSIWIGILIYLVLGAISGLLTVHDYNFRLGPQIMGISFAILPPWAVLTPLALWFSHKVPLKPASWVLGVFVHLLLFLLLTLLHGYALSLQYHYSGNLSPDMVGYESWQHTGHFLFLDDMFLFDALIYIFLIASQNIANFHSLAQQKELDAVRMQGQLTESRLQALLMQVNPHFLFNTLNSIAVLVRKQDTKGAGSMIEKLSAFFRYTLDTPAEQWVPLQQELEMMEQYLDIEKVRIGSRLVVTRNIPENTLGILIPMLITQPLVENAIRHGIGKKPGNCELLIEAVLVDGLLTLRIKDTGVGCNFNMLAPGNGIGLENVKERLRQSYGSDVGLRLKGTVGEGVEVTLELPAIRRPGREP